MASRMDLFLQLIGGEQNLPRKLTPPLEPEPELKAVDVYEWEDYKNLPQPNTPYAFGDLELHQPLSDPLQWARATASSDDGRTCLFDSRKGEQSPLGINFSPFLAVTKYCYKFTPRAWTQTLATAFFDQDKIYRREWDLYYVSSSYGGVITFVAEYQLLALLDEINIAFPEAKLVVDEYSIEGGLVIDFEDLPPYLRPRYLGRCTSRAQYRSWMFQLSQEPTMDLPQSPSDRSLKAFQEKTEAAIDAGKTKSKAQRARKHEERLGQRQVMVKQSYRGQSYLGLYPKRTEDSLMPELGSLSLNAINTEDPVPYAFDQEPIFIAIDVEAFEEPPRMVTEIGVATLDTRDLKGVAPGEVGKNWHQFIRGRHFRILEYKHLKNYKYVKGCPDAFEFGNSEFIAKASTGTTLGSCFREPYSKPGEDFPPLGAKPPPTPGADVERRNIIIVGHDLGQDVNYCRQVGFDVFGRGGVIDSMDTMNMFRAYKKDAGARCSLSNIIYECDLTAWNPHNAGNDAVYTLQAMLAICVKEASERNTDEAAKKRESAMESKVEELIETAKETAREDTDGWDLQCEDGGEAVRPTQQDFEKKPKQQNMLYTMGGAPLDV